MAPSSTFSEELADEESVRLGSKLSAAADKAGGEVEAKKAFEEREGVRLTYLPFIVKAVVESLKEYPILNSAWDGDRIVLRKRINVGIAVDLEDALVVPVIPDADELNLLGLARKIDDAVRRARNRQLSLEDVSGGTFTVNNPGALGSVVSTPIINHPEAAMVGVGRLIDKPWVVDGQLAVRTVGTIGLTFDHRVCDGGTAGGFIRYVADCIERPTTLLLDL